MIKVALTGNIASGKSLAEKFLRQKGYVVYDTDCIAHDILEKSANVRGLFSGYDIFTDGNLDRKKIGDIVFNNCDKLRELEGIIHPLVREKISELFELHQSGKYIFISVPQLFEAGFDKMFDKIILISAEESIRLKRVIERNNLTESEAISRISSQIEEERKIAKSDYVVYNNGSVDVFIESLQNLISNTFQTIS